jgi:hypothetical protein
LPRESRGIAADVRDTSQADLMVSVALVGVTSLNVNATGPIRISSPSFKRQALVTGLPST